MSNVSKYVIRYSELRETYNMCDAIDILVSEAKAEPPPPVQSDSGVEEVLKAIHQNTQGPRYWPPIKLALDEYASLKTKELMESLEESNKENEILINGIKFFLNWLKEKRPSLCGCGAPIMILEDLLKTNQ